MARVLVVDDSKFMRTVICEALKEGGHTILAEAEDGIEALKEYKKERPDIVTMDVTMWGKDGLKAVEEIIEFDPGAKIIMISALNENTIKLSKENIKAKAFLTKPFKKEELLEVVNKLV